LNVIKDPIHGHVPITDSELALLDQPEMQRLRGIKQVAMAPLVYPGANHTRFEHSIGTMHLASEMARRLELSKEEAGLLRSVALLHDVGHSAFSHETEILVKRFLKKDHEQLGLERIKSTFLKDLVSEQFSFQEFEKAFMGEGIGNLISFELGADRMDYLLRDSHYTGVAYGVIDTDRIVHTVRMHNGKAVVDRRGLEAAESLLIARFLMFSTVYYHHAVRIAGAMLRKAVETAVENKSLSTSELASLPDYGLLNALKKDGRAKELVERLEGRKLFKRALILPYGGLPGEVKNSLETLEGINELEDSVAEAAGLAKGSVVLDYQKSHGEVSLESVKVLIGGEEKNLEALSELVKSLKKDEEERRTLIVACAGSEIEKVKKTSEGLLIA